MSKKITVDFFKKAKGNHKLTTLTAYDYSTAKLLDQAGIDALLVGDSLGMVMLGYENTLKVTVNDVIHHTQGVSRGAEKAMVVADMPFLSYHINIEDSIRNAGRLITEGGAQAVKLEGGQEIEDKIKAIIKAQIPVMGHLGLTPQSVNAFGGFKVQGKDEAQAKKIIEDAKRLEDCGVFAIVLECIPEKLAQIITENISIPTIGIGAGKFCDGQVLVTQDMLGMYTDFKPRFVKQFCNMGEIIKKSVENYITEVQEGTFPAPEHTFPINQETLQKLY